MSLNVSIPTDTSAEKMHATAAIMRAHGYAERMGWGTTLVLVVFLLLVFRCNDVTLWDLKARHCVEPTAGAAP